MISPAWLAFLGVLVLDLAVSLVFLTKRRRHARSEKTRAGARALIHGLVERKREDPDEDGRIDAFIRRRPWLFLEECARILDSIELDGGPRGRLRGALERNRMDTLLVRDLHSNNPFRRARAATFLPLIPSNAVLVSMIKALETEVDHGVKLLLCEGFTRMGHALAVPSMIDSLAGSSPRYQRGLWGLLMEFGQDMSALFPLLAARPEKEIQLLLIHYASRYRSTEAKSYVASRVDSPDLDISHAAFGALASAYPSAVDHARYMGHDDFVIRNLTVESLGVQPTAKSLDILFDHLDDPVVHKSAVFAVRAIVRAKPDLFWTIMLRCLNEQRPAAHAVLVEVMAGYVDYLMEKLLSPNPRNFERVLFEIVQHGMTSEIVTFLNRNTNPEIETRGLSLLGAILLREPAHADALKPYLDRRLLARLGLPPAGPPAKPRTRAENPNLPLLYVFLAIGAGLAPAICAALAFWPATLHAPAELFRSFLIAFNSLFAAYAASLNGIYLLLLFFSFLGVRSQARRGALLGRRLLFKENMLPSISIITPAYNEEASIVESVSSLLNLRYPDYEVIVVNDGSTDRTLETLVSRFGLERTGVFIYRYLNTQQIRATYANKLYPELLVIDKENGGKADSLNAGINAARKQYFAGIDADSLLDTDALLNLTGQFMFSRAEVVAAGGNILPVNGCTVRLGSVVETRIPARPLARFQTVEYLRAFMTGRVGWAQIQSLLVISGAFGVFHRRRVVDARGYLTRSERFLKDTVGEDMELVVRLTRGLRENRTPFSVLYGYDANCWTEVPEKFRILSRQRDRWQRGLLDIVTFHSQMIFNPRYGRAGLFGFPYFLVYEVLGPWFETEGHLVFFASLALGAIGLPLFLVVFTATVLLGLLTSISSLVIAEYRRQYFSLRDKLRLVLYAVLENFGFRQLMNLLRVRGFLRMLAKAGGWGKMERRGLGAGNKK